MSIWCRFLIDRRSNWSWIKKNSTCVSETYSTQHSNHMRQLEISSMKVFSFIHLLTPLLFSCLSVLSLSDCHYTFFFVFLYFLSTGNITSSLNVCFFLVHMVLFSILYEGVLPSFTCWYPYFSPVYPSFCLFRVCLIVNILFSMSNCMIVPLLICKWFCSQGQFVLVNNLF